MCRRRVRRGDRDRAGRRLRPVVRRPPVRPGGVGGARPSRVRRMRRRGAALPRDAARGAPAANRPAQRTLAPRAAVVDRSRRALRHGHRRDRYPDRRSRSRRPGPHHDRLTRRASRIRSAAMPLQWVLFNLTGTLVDPTVLAAPLGDSGADEELVLSALDDAIAMAMVDNLTGARNPLDVLVEAAMRRRLRLAGSDEDRAAAALELMGTMPAYLEVPGAL